jgi:hypothetical protein
MTDVWTNYGHNTGIACADKTDEAMPRQGYRKLAVPAKSIKFAMSMAYRGEIHNIC